MTSIAELMKMAAAEEATTTPLAFTVAEQADGFYVVLGDAPHYGPYAARKTANRKMREANGQAEPAMTLDSMSEETPQTWAESQGEIAELEAELDGKAFVAKIEGDLAAYRGEPTAQDYIDRAEESGLTAAREAFDDSVAARRVVTLAGQIVTREDWLLAAATLIEQVLADKADLELGAYRVTCGWPSKGGAGGKKRVLGQAWNSAASADDHGEVFISPMEAEPRTVLAILAHELIHIALPIGTGHKGPFIKAAAAIGFRAPFTQLNMGDEMAEWLDPMLASLPAYPHARLDPAGAEGAPKKQTTRMIKAVCTVDDCGYTARLTRKWIDALGAPICPAHGVMTCEGMEPQDDEDGEGED